MSVRVDLDESLPPVPVPGRVLNELCAHALETLPEECCGLVMGDENERFARVFRCHNDMTARHRRDPASHPRDGRDGFWMNEGDVHAALAAERDGRQVTAVYHSHVDVGVYLSDLDLAFAEGDGFPFAGADQIVLSVTEGRVKGIGLFRREEGAFAGHPIRVLP